METNSETKSAKNTTNIDSTSSNSASGGDPDVEPEEMKNGAGDGTHVETDTGQEDTINEQQKDETRAEAADVKEVNHPANKVSEGEDKEMNEDGEIDSKNKDEHDEDIDVSREPALEDDARNKMFEEGLMLDKEGKKLQALKCYLKCLVGLKENSRFALLPQCLRNIGDIYYGRNEYDKAVSFIQAEKLYYESVLIDDTELQQHIDEVTAKGAEGTDTSIDALRATEYEQLAKLCLEEKQPQLALEYAGKSTKLRQKVFGDGHPLVQQSLDFFATVYAEVGKVQYTESMSKYDTAGGPVTTGVTSNGTSTPEPTSILRRRKTLDGGDKEKKVRFDESTLAAESTSEREERCARTILLILFFMLLFVLIVLGIYIFCSVQPSSVCRNFRNSLKDMMMQVKYWYFNLWSNKNTKYS